MQYSTIWYMTALDYTFLSQLHKMMSNPNEIILLAGLLL